MPKPIAVGKVRTFKHEKVQAIVVRNHDFESTRYHPEAQAKYSDFLDPGVHLLTTEGLYALFSLLSPEVAVDATGPLAEYYGVEVYINPDDEVDGTRKHEMRYMSEWLPVQGSEWLKKKSLVIMSSSCCSQNVFRFH